MSRSLRRPIQIAGATLLTLSAVAGGYLLATHAPTTTTAHSANVADDSASVLSMDALNTIELGQAPDTPERVEHYTVAESYSLNHRTVKDTESSDLPGPDGDRFPASSNHCGETLFYVTFRVPNPESSVEVGLRNPLGEIEIHDTASEGWLLTDNCHTPTFAFAGAHEESYTVTDVAVTVHRYEQASTS